jgi:hypothetical protein
MEVVLPNVETVLVEAGTAQVLPYLPIGRHAVSLPAQKRPAAALPERSGRPPAPAPSPATVAIPAETTTGEAAR